MLRSNFGIGSKGYWTETNVSRSTKTDSKYQYINKYSYPLNTIGKRENMGKLLDYLKQYHIFGLGRWGEWEHYNSDVVVDKALDLADGLIESLPIEANYFIRDFSGQEKGEKHIYSYTSMGEQFFPRYPRFSEDLVQGIYGGRTVMYDMLHIWAFRTSIY